MLTSPLAEKAESTPMSLPPVFVAALTKLAFLDGHTNRSAVVRKLINRAMQEEFGLDWRTDLAIDRAESEAA